MKFFDKTLPTTPDAMGDSILLTFTTPLPFLSSSLSLKRRNTPLTSSALASQPNCHGREFSEKYVFTLKFMNQPLRKWQFHPSEERKKSPLLIKSALHLSHGISHEMLLARVAAIVPLPFSLLVLKFPDLWLVLRTIKFKLPFVDVTALKAELD